MTYSHMVTDKVSVTLVKMWLKWGVLRDGETISPVGVWLYTLSPITFGASLAMFFTFGVSLLLSTIDIPLSCFTFGVFTLAAFTFGV